MQLAGPRVFGPPADRAEAIAVLRTAVELGINHIDTADFYGPHVTNEIIREALAPYPDDLLIVTKVGAVRDEARRLGARADPGRPAPAGPRQPASTSGSTPSTSSTCEWAAAMTGTRRYPARSRSSSLRWPRCRPRG